jgi:hypothetical protein
LLSFFLRDSTMAYKQRWLEYFEVLDADNNGYVDAKDGVVFKKVL